MQPLKPANTYHAIISDRKLFRGAADLTAFKVYFVDIIGRKDPSRTEWDKCGLSRDQFMASLTGVPGLEGVGLITAFPHITKAFRFGPESEIVMNVRAWNTQGMTPLDLSRSDGYAEFACLAEAVLAADEFALWANAASVAEYLAKWSPYAGGPVSSRDKLMTYWRP
ncbi:MAG: hypothetical protein A3K19_24130 [Lentisphaerae bacterium RIFOXYB12_FULL_65_16]|nr:MAG: hypothetical protein A3K18_27165 [Lentisphaerae bacterium RIFOXYA12_64_32]OGV87621.1 MAG: hypothetical protein A3K19_24130 [Lentisphaerae bacterium RIFOXYB12_FULL_65_16]